MDIVERLRGRSEYERNLGINLIYLHHIDVENICKEIERLRDEVHFDNQTIKSLHQIKKRLRKALKEIEYLDRPQIRGLPRRVTIQEIALAALKEIE